MQTNRAYLCVSCSLQNAVCMRSETLTIWRLLFVHQIERIPPWSLGQIQSLSYLGEGPTQTFRITDSLA